MAIRVDVGHQATTIREEARQRFLQVFNEETLSPVTLHRIDRVVTLPCGHNLDESSARRLQAGPVSLCKCPMDQIPFRTFVRNPALQNIIDAGGQMEQVFSTNPSVEAMAQLERAALSSPSMEAIAHFEKGKRFAEQGDNEQAIQGCLAAITLSPDFAKAHAYLHFLLDQQSRGPSALQSVSKRSSAQSNEGIGSNSSRRNGELSACSPTTRPARVEERSTAPRRNPPLAARVSSVPSEPRGQELGLVDGLKLYFSSLYQLNALIIVEANRPFEPALNHVGEAVGEAVYKLGNRVGVL